MGSLLIQIVGELHFADGNFASFELVPVNGTNVNLVGYSESLKEFFVRFSDDKTYIYKDVPKYIFDGITAPHCGSIGSFMNRKVKGFFRYERVEWGLHKASPTEVCKIFRTMQYNLDWLIGCDVTDQGKKVEAIIGADAFEALFWKAEYQPIPDNCTRIK